MKLGGTDSGNRPVRLALLRAYFPEETTMPRKSAAALAVATITKAPLRTEPPAHLSDEAAALWRAITAAYPPGHFQAPHLPLLEGYCRAVVTMRQADAILDRESIITSEGQPHPALAIRDQQGKLACQFATKLRLAISSAVRADSSKVRPGAVGAKPWEFET